MFVDRPRVPFPAYLQYNSQVATFSSNIRFALLNRSGTGLFVVYNSQQDTSSRTPTELLGRSFIIKMSRLFDLSKKIGTSGHCLLLRRAH